MIQFENAIKKYNELILNELKQTGIICWIAGGSLRDYFMGAYVNTDHDIFFPDESQYNKALTHFLGEGAEILWSSENATKIKYENKKYDLIKHYFPNPIETIKEFDFTVSMLAVDYDKIYHGETTFIDLAKRQLIINKITYPASTLIRAFKYQKKGFSICKGEILKIIKAVQDMPKLENESEENNESEKTSFELTGVFIGID